MHKAVAICNRQAHHHPTMYSCHFEVAAIATVG